MPLVNVCFFALLLIAEPVGQKGPRTPQRKAAIGVISTMLGLNVLGMFLS